VVTFSPNMQSYCVAINKDSFTLYTFNMEASHSSETTEQTCIPQCITTTKTYLNNPLFKSL